MQFTTINDARTFVENSGVYEWVWSGTASAEGFARYLWENVDTVDVNDYDYHIAKYLLSVDEDPSDYGVTLKKAELIAMRSDFVSRRETISSADKLADRVRECSIEDIDGNRVRCHSCWRFEDGSILIEFDSGSFGAVRSGSNIKLVTD